MPTITDVRREPDGSLVLTIREEREVIIAAKDALAASGKDAGKLKSVADLKALAVTTNDAAKLTDAEALVAAKSGKGGEVAKP